MAGESDNGPAYPTTIWTEIERADQPDQPAALQALESLLARYYGPLRNHLMFKFQASETQAEDWLHSFVWRKVLLETLLAHARKDRGRFRTFLLNALDNFVVSEQRRERSAKRRPQSGLESLEGPEARQVRSPEAGPANTFDREWARAVVEEAVGRMQAECAAKGETARWSLFERRVLNPLLDGVRPPPYDELVGPLGFRSPAEAFNTLLTGKRMFARLLRAVVAEYAKPGEVEAEIRELQAILARAD